MKVCFVVSLFLILSTLHLTTDDDPMSTNQLTKETKFKTNFNQNLKENEGLSHDVPVNGVRKERKLSVTDLTQKIVTRKLQNDDETNLNTNDDFNSALDPVGQMTDESFQSPITAMSKFNENRKTQQLDQGQLPPYEMNSQNPDGEEEGEEEESPIDEEQEVEENAALETEDDLERVYKKISETLKLYENAYQQCIDNIPDKFYNAVTVTECVGENYSLLIDDLDYEKRKLLSMIELKIRDSMLLNCYQQSEGNLENAKGCDLVEQDTIRMLWKELDYPRLLNVNRSKYENLHAQMESNLFGLNIEALKPTFERLDKLLEELYDHRMITIANVKIYIDGRTEQVRAYWEARKNIKRIKTTSMQVTSRLVQPPHYYINLDNMPRPVLMNGKPQTYSISNNFYVEQWAKNMGPQRYSNVNTPNTRLTDWNKDPTMAYYQSEDRKLNL